VLRALYAAAADFRNFLQPAMKLKEKVRTGGKVRRVYEEPRTPYQRLLELGTLKPSQRRELEQRYQSLDPVKLRRRIEQLRTELFDLLERQNDTPVPKPRRHGPGIVVGRRKAVCAP
jgi:hypothetical protein